MNEDDAFEERMIIDAVRGLLSTQGGADQLDSLAVVCDSFSTQGFADLGDGSIELAAAVSRELGRAACPLPFIPAVVVNRLRARPDLDENALPRGPRR